MIAIIDISLSDNGYDSGYHLWRLVGDFARRVV